MLKPCPFCGFIPDINHPDCIYPINTRFTIYSINCYESYEGGGCGASVLGDSEAHVIKKWNSRYKEVLK